jgi:hypothetical protein
VLQTDLCDGKPCGAASGGGAAAAYAVDHLLHEGKPAAGGVGLGSVPFYPKAKKIRLGSCSPKLPSAR